MLVIAVLFREFFLMTVRDTCTFFGDRCAWLCALIKSDVIVWDFFFEMYNAVLSRLEWFYHECMSIKCCRFGVASIVACFMLLLAVFNWELFVNTKWKVTAGVVRWPDCDCRVSEYTVYSAALNRLVPVPLSCSTPTIRGRGGAGWAGAVQLCGLVHEAHNISWDHI